MAYTVSLEVNLSQLSGLHPDLVLLRSNFDGDDKKYPAEVIINCIHDESSYLTLRTSLSNLLSTFKLESHLNNFIYISHLQIENNASDYLFDEEFQKHAYNNIKQLIKLIELNEGSTNRDLSITIRNKRDKNLTVTFETSLSMKHVWEDLYTNLVKSLTKWSGNHIIMENLKGVELTKDNLLEVQKQLRTRADSFWNKSLANLCRIILNYMVEQNSIPKSNSPTSQQANFLFNLLALFNFINEDSIQSEKDDYVRSLLKNNS